MSRRRRRNNTKEKSRTAAGLLALFFGGWGVHKFYLNDPGVGMLYIFIFFMTANIFAFPASFILGWLDAFRIFSMSEADFDRKYNKHIAQDGRDYLEPNKPRSRRTRQRPPVITRDRNRRPPVSRAIQKSNPFKKSGLKKYKEFELEGAIEDFNQGLEINPNDVALHFNLACAYSLTEDKEKSFRHLSRAVELGYNDFEKIQTHDDLAFLRIQQEFDDFKDKGYRMDAIRLQRKEGEEEERKSPPQIEEIKDDVLLSQLNKLAELRKKGLLTENEFNLERKKLLRR